MCLCAFFSCAIFSREMPLVCGATPSRPFPKIHPLRVLFPLLFIFYTRTMSSEVPEGGVLGKKLAWGGVGWTERNEAPSRQALLRTPSKNPSQNPPPFEAHCKAPSKNPFENLLESSLENLLRTLLRSVFLHDPLVFTL